MKWSFLLIVSACVVVMSARNEKLASIYIDDITDPQVSPQELDSENCPKEQFCSCPQRLFTACFIAEWSGPDLVDDGSEGQRSRHRRCPRASAGTGEGQDHRQGQGRHQVQDTFLALLPT
jgi:hypothetical protein